MGDLEKVVNIGKVLAKQLHEVGIESLEELKKVGARQTWLKIKAIDSSACYNRLCALEGAIQGIRWHDLSEKDKKELKEFYQDFK